MAKRRPPNTHGLVVIDKPAGMTSHDVVAHVRRRFGERQVGHAGTLDPDATGVLLVGVGKCTKLLRFLTALGKTYTGQIRLGSTTDSLDSTGVVTATFDMSAVTITHARQVIREHLLGLIMQVPPMVSAVRVDGQRLHELARQGIEVERQPRPVTVSSFEIQPTDDQLVLEARVRCSQGTYVRSLADDLGRLLGGGAHLHGLRRVAVGSFTTERASTVEEAPLLSMAEAMADYPAVTVDEGRATLVGQGRVFARTELGVDASGGPWAVLGPEGELLAMYEPHGDRQVKPAAMVSVEQAGAPVSQ